MKQLTKRLVALAMATVTAMSTAAVIRRNPESKIRNTAVAATTSKWYPERGNIDVKYASKYSELPDGSNVKKYLADRYKSSITSPQGMYSLYTIWYTEPSGSDYTENAVLMFDPVFRPELGKLNAETRIKRWMKYYVQFINAEKEITGVSKKHIVVALDAMDIKTCQDIVDSNLNGTVKDVVSLNTYDSEELEEAITAFSNTYMTWGVLHEASHAYEDTATNPFVSNNDVFTNLRLLCAVRSLDRDGQKFPDVIWKDPDLNIKGRNLQNYFAASVFQASCTFYEDDRKRWFLPNTLSTILNEGHKLFHTRLGILLDIGSNGKLAPWNPKITNYIDLTQKGDDYTASRNFASSRAYADSLETSKYDAYWNKLLALCISYPKKVNTTKLPFMKKPVKLFNNYIKEQDYNIDPVKLQQNKVCVTVLDTGKPASPEGVTGAVQYVIKKNYTSKTSDGKIVWPCSLGTLRALRTYDFLLGNHEEVLDPLFTEGECEYFNIQLKGYAAGHNRINYFMVADKIVGKYN